jgi:HK97 family phage prohead protease
MEFRWDGPQQVKNLGDDPPKSAISALFAIPGDSKSDSSLPHHDVSSDGHVGAADKDGCIAAIAALNGSRGGVSADTADKNKAYSHLASHLRAMGVEPPAKQFAAGAPLELLQQRRSSMLRVPERLSLHFGAAGVEMRAKANGTGGTSFQFNGYAAVFDHPFQMWDFWGDEFTEIVNQGAFTRTLANGCDVPFLIGHNDAGIPMARTKSGTMTLGQDSHGLWVNVPGMDGSRDDVRALASAVERGDMDEMSCAFIALGQQWSPDYMQRNMTEMDLHKGDVSAVVFGANDGTAGSSMVAFPAESLSLRRPTGIRQQRAASLHAPMSGAHSHSHSAYGDQGGDETHEHLHVHNNDANHSHSHDQRAAGTPHEHRDGGGYPDSNSPDYDPQQHAADPGQLVCPHGGCTADGCACGAAACNGGCPVTGGAMNGPDAKHCDQCGGSLYSEDGTIIVSDDGVPEEIEGGDLMAQAFAKNKAALELRQRQLALLGAGS